jgi:hypothetical protein
VDFNLVSIFRLCGGNPGKADGAAGGSAHAAPARLTRGGGTPRARRRTPSPAAGGPRRRCSSP